MRNAKPDVSKKKAMDSDVKKFLEQDMKKAIARGGELASPEWKEEIQRLKVRKSLSKEEIVYLGSHDLDILSGETVCCLCSINPSEHRMTVRQRTDPDAGEESFLTGNFISALLEHVMPKMFRKSGMKVSVCRACRYMKDIAPGVERDFEFLPDKEKGNQYGFLFLNEKVAQRIIEKKKTREG